MNMMGLLLGVLAMSEGTRNYMYKIPETNEEKKQRLKDAEIERNKLNGLTEFFYGENSLWALNQKSADRKAIKLGYKQ
jgi:hypothetical protein